MKNAKQKALSFPRAKLPRILLGLACLGLLLLGGASLLSWLAPVESPVLAKTAVKKPLLTAGKPVIHYAARTAHAADLDGEMDFVADVLFGQPDFATGTAPTSATATNLFHPNDIFVFDLSGQIFIADTAHNRVLGWKNVDFYESGDPADLVLGQPDFTATDVISPPTSATMHGPTGVTVGFDGLVYVSDTGNNRVLVFFPVNYLDDEFFPGESFPEFENGQVADYILGQPDEFSGAALPTGPDTLNRPMGLVTDVNDNLVVADSGNNRVLIYEWNQGSGEIGPNANWVVGQEEKATDLETFSSNDAPDPPTRRSMNNPTSVAVDTLGRELSVADTGNNRVLVYASDPIDLDADFVIGQPDFVSNSPNNGGLSATSLNRPTGLKMDAGSRLFVADTNNQRVLVFDRTTPTNVSANAVFGQPDFTSNTANNGGISASSLYTPTGIATDSLYMDVYITDAGNNRALQFYQPLDNPAPLIAELDPGSVRAGRDGFTLDIWGSGIISDTVIEVNGVARGTGSNFLGLTEIEIGASEVVTTGQITITLRNPTPGGGVSAPAVLSIYEPTAGDDQADSIIGQQGFTTDAGPFAPVAADTIYEPGGVVVDPATGRLFVADTGNARILSWPSAAAQADGQKADLVIGKPDFTTYFYSAGPDRNIIRPVGLALDSQGNLYATDAQENLVLVYTAPFTNNMTTTLIIGNVGNPYLLNPLALALDSQDNLYVADSFNHRVLFYEKPLSSGDVTPDRVFGQPDLVSVQPNAGGSISADGLHFPSGVAVDAADNLYVSDSHNHRLLVYLDPANGDTTADVVFGQAGDFTTGTANKGGISAASLNYPYGLLVAGNGSLYVADSDNHRLLRYDAPLTSDCIADVVLGQNGSFARGQTNQGERTSQDRAARNQRSLNQPAALGLNANGDLFVADTGNNRVLGFQGIQAITVQKKLYLPSVTR